MLMSEKSKQHVDSCRFCWMCHHICPVGNATGQERNTARARALGISLVNREAIDLSEIMDNIYECATCGGCVSVCATGWDPVMFTKETRLLAAMEGKTPDYINNLIDNCLEKGNAYGAEAAQFAGHTDKTDTLFFLGTDARYMAKDCAEKAIKVMELTGEAFTVLNDEPASGAQLDFLIGAAEETKQQMKDCAKVLNTFKTVVVYDPTDAKAMKHEYKEYGVEITAQVVTFTEYLSKANLGLKNTGKTVCYQDPFRLARDLKETEPAREIITKCAELKEMLLNREETIWAGDVLMAQYTPTTIYKVSERRLENVKSMGYNAVVTACVGEYVALKNVKQDNVEIISLEELILAAAK